MDPLPLKETLTVGFIADEHKKRLFSSVSAAGLRHRFSLGLELTHDARLPPPEECHSHSESSFFPVRAVALKGAWV